MQYLSILQWLIAKGRRWANVVVITSISSRTHAHLHGVPLDSFHIMDLLTPSTQRDILTETHGGLKYLDLSDAWTGQTFARGLLLGMRRCCAAWLRDVALHLASISMDAPGFGSHKTLRLQCCAYRLCRIIPRRSLGSLFKHCWHSCGGILTLVMFHLSTMTATFAPHHLTLDYFVLSEDHIPAISSLPSWSSRTRQPLGEARAWAL